MKSLKTALINIRRLPYKSLIAICMISITFFVTYSFSLLIIGSEQVLNYFESRPTLIAFFNIKATDEQLAQVKTAIQELDFVEEVLIVSKQEALEYYKEKQDNPLLLELVTAEILPASIEVSTIEPTYLPEVETKLQQFEQIEEIVLQRDVIDQMISWAQSLRLVGLVIVIVLVVLSLFVISSTISFKIANQGKLVSILRIIGASNTYIITPYIYEGFIYGLVGSVIGWSGSLAWLLYLSPWLQTFVGEIMQLPPPWQFFAIQLGIGTSLGLFFGGIASLVAGKKLIKK